jgi:methionine-rich copper-binding protein CopC
MRRSSLYLGLVLLLLSVPSVEAHAKLVKSEPPRDAVLATAPSRIQLWFNERLEVRFARIAVWNASGQRVDSADIRAIADDNTAVSVGLQQLPPGIYTVKYRVLSVDSHVIENQWHFTIRE